MVVINFIQNYKKKFMFKLFNKKLNKICEINLTVGIKKDLTLL